MPKGTCTLEIESLRELSLRQNYLSVHVYDNAIKQARVLTEKDGTNLCQLLDFLSDCDEKLESNNHDLVLFRQDLYYFSSAEDQECRRITSSYFKSPMPASKLITQVHPQQYSELDEVVTQAANMSLESLYHKQRANGNLLLYGVGEIHRDHPSRWTLFALLTPYIKQTETKPQPKRKKK